MTVMVALGTAVEAKLGATVSEEAASSSCSGGGAANVVSVGASQV